MAAGAAAATGASPRCHAGGMTWTDRLRGDPLPWLLDPEDPAVRAAALVRLLDRHPDDPQVVCARAEAMRTDPIAATLAAQSAEGWWVKPGPGYAPKYTGTVWSLIFLDQLGADPADERVQRACEYVLRMNPDVIGRARLLRIAQGGPSPPSSVLHCLNGNLVRALIGFGHLEDPRVQSAISWAARAITGQDAPRYYASGTTGPGFSCGANEALPCAWGAAKAMLALARVPESERSPQVREADRRWASSSCSPGTRRVRTTRWDGATRSRHPRGSSSASPRGTWPTCCRSSKPWPSSVMPVIERLAAAYDWLLGQQDADGPLAQPLRVPRQDLGGLRTPGRPLQVGHAAGLHGAARGGMRTPEAQLVTSLLANRAHARARNTTT